MLRNYASNNISSKVFKNYSKKGGGFFDPCLQQGGISNLDVDKKRRSKSRTRGVLNDSGNLGKCLEKSGLNKSVNNKNNMIYRENEQDNSGKNNYEFYDD